MAKDRANRFADRGMEFMSIIDEEDALSPKREGEPEPKKAKSLEEYTDEELAEHLKKIEEIIQRRSEDKEVE